MSDRDPAHIHSLKNWGIDNSRSNSHVNAMKAWTLTKGTKDVVVAIIDTGIDPEHPDLKPNLWKDPKTGYYGWDFVANKPNPKDTHGHGTHVAGIIGAIANKKNGTAGVAQRVALMILKYYDPKASGMKNLENAVKAINWAVDHGAQIINYSGGGAEYSKIEHDALIKAQAKGIAVVAAAGNEHSNVDETMNAYYPAAYDLDNIISVTAIDINNRILKSSNWGKKKIHVAAPGDSIYSTLPGKAYGFMTGTSQATAFVSGLVALIKSMDSALKPSEIRNIIEASVDKLGTLKNKVVSGGKINAYAALKRVNEIKKRKGTDTVVSLFKSASNKYQSTFSRAIAQKK